MNILHQTEIVTMVLLHQTEKFNMQVVPDAESRKQTKSAENVSHECIVHSWGSKEAESAADEIKRKSEEHNPVGF